MNVQRVSNIRQQNFGEVAVLEVNGGKSFVNFIVPSDAPCRADWFVNADKVLLLLSSAKEKASLDRLDESFSQACKADQMQIAQFAIDRKSKRVIELGQKVKPMLIKTLDDLKSVEIPGFEGLCQYIREIQLDPSISPFLRRILGSH